MEALRDLAVEMAGEARRELLARERRAWTRLADAVLELVAHRLQAGFDDQGWWFPEARFREKLHEQLRTRWTRLRALPR